MPASHRPFIVKSTMGRDVAIGVLAGAALLGFLFWGILTMSRGVAGHSVLTGTIIGRHFQPRAEEQLTVGRGGLDEKNLDGVYTMDVRTPDGQTFKVFVEKPVYESHKNGDELSFLPPPAKNP